jgi:hypothetical protein
MDGDGLNISYVETQVLISVIIRSSVFWDIVRCCPMKANRRCGRSSISTCCLLHAAFLLTLLFKPEMEATCSAETSVDFYWNTQYHIPEDRTLYVHTRLQKCIYLLRTARRTTFRVMLDVFVPILGAHTPSLS